ncbi:carbon-nitrogen hydrolase family protein [Helicovermis profundi]|uniref:Carbon-nitrogen hydrolase family protein n=1 Tax=Helicovermis profundi TaxID=3065157 RepID=A0AAU9EDC3_9FIRM|nr:carbon-nitrogen hydrolase family protein [Clostridia bacterium S502]
MDNFKISVCQLKPENNKETNIKKAEIMIREAKNNGSDIIVLPEMFNCPYDNKFFLDYSEEYPGYTTAWLSKLSSELGIYIIGGSIPELENGKLYNTSFSFNRKGELIGKHRKLHLFDIDIEDKIFFKESDTLSYGSKITVIDTEYGKIGIAICYDMRFPEYMRILALEGAKLIVVPAAFNTVTGPMHWNLLARARALDNQVYFVAASPARNIHSSYKAYGHSIIVDPFGNIINEANIEEGIISAKIDFDYVNKIRDELPLLKHRREDLYKISYK